MDITFEYGIGHLTGAPINPDATSGNRHRSHPQIDLPGGYTAIILEKYTRPPEVAIQYIQADDRGLPSGKAAWIRGVHFHGPTLDAALEQTRKTYPSKRVILNDPVAAGVIALFWKEHMGE